MHFICLSNPKGNLIFILFRLITFLSKLILWCNGIKSWFTFSLVSNLGNMLLKIRTLPTVLASIYGINFQVTPFETRPLRVWGSQQPFPQAGVPLLREVRELQSQQSRKHAGRNLVYRFTGEKLKVLTYKRPLRKVSGASAVFPWKLPGKSLRLAGQDWVKDTRVGRIHFPGLAFLLLPTQGHQHRLVQLRTKDSVPNLQPPETCIKVQLQTVPRRP